MYSDIDNHKETLISTVTKTGSIWQMPPVHVGSQPSPYVVTRPRPAKLGYVDADGYRQLIQFRPRSKTNMGYLGDRQFHSQLR